MGGRGRDPHGESVYARTLCACGASLEHERHRTCTGCHVPQPCGGIEMQCRNPHASCGVRFCARCTRLGWARHEPACVCRGCGAYAPARADRKQWRRCHMPEPCAIFCPACAEVSYRVRHTRPCVARQKDQAEMRKVQEEFQRGLRELAEREGIESPERRAARERAEFDDVFGPEE